MNTWSFDQCDGLTAEKCSHRIFASLYQTHINEENPTKQDYGLNVEFERLFDAVIYGINVKLCHFE